MLLLVILVNLAALALTFERTIVVTTAIGVVVLLLRAGARERARLVAWAPVAAIGVLVTLALAGPTVLTAFEKRITSLSAYKTDPSYIYRVEESRYVSERISEHPLTGSGLGASILIGRPGSNEPLAPRSYAENGYLWLAWKLGWPGAALLWALIAVAIVWPGRRREDPLFNVVRRGIQVGLLVFALSTFVFGSLDSVENTPALGVLLAICAAPLVLPASRGRTVRP
jgi:O-antigen ligase